MDGPTVERMMTGPIVTWHMATFWQIVVTFSWIQGRIGYVVQPNILIAFSWTIGQTDGPTVERMKAPAPLWCDIWRHYTTYFQRCIWSYGRCTHRAIWLNYALIYTKKPLPLLHSLAQQSLFYGRIENSTITQPSNFLHFLSFFLWNWIWWKM